MVYRKKNYLYKISLIPYYLVLIFFILLPIFFVILNSFQETNNEGFVHTTFTLKYYHSLFTNFSFFYILLRSLSISIITVFLLFIISYPLGYIVSKFNPLTQGILVLLINGMIWINMILKTQALVQIFSFLEKIFHVIILETNLSMFIGFIYLFLPYMFLPIYLSIISIDPHLINVAKDLGANETQVFKKIIFPLSFNESFIGCILVSFQVVTNIVVSKYLGHSTIPMISELIENQTLLIGDIQSVCSIAVNLILLVLLVFIFCKKRK
ncbi:ABC-type spermidine/putrescine transport, permease component I [Candidatus Phytoplasma mali]|uniref:ABC-type spermidine/putrescine transport, permease component I n=1 Tax=Phytoplasma mali (strain AT) TaxID=482235 RepID=B3QZU1_PHYMT|nr:ABC transporter permease subunit [Candidatus Phytoplasma mali]CAP18478.1 ABC-type spermidine/putrescine transport, permease component I [Candidatus Phytoplasma mali]